MFGHDEEPEFEKYSEWGNVTTQGRYKRVNLVTSAGIETFWLSENSGVLTFNPYLYEKDNH